MKITYCILCYLHKPLIVQEVKDKNVRKPGDIFIYISFAVPASPKIFFMTFGDFISMSLCCKT